MKRASTEDIGTFALSLFGTLFEALKKDVDLAALYPLLGVEQSNYSVLFWIGSEGTGPGLHWDSDYEQILYQCVGRKTVTCFSPEDVACLYPAGSSASWNQVMPCTFRRSGFTTRPRADLA